MDVKGKLYYGDNLEVLRNHIPSESVDLIYLDPPFNSNATYNVLFKSPKTGDDSSSQIQAFDDTWHWGEDDAQAIDEIMRSGHTDIANLIQALRKFLGENDMMAYLVMMAIRLMELHRVLKPTGSLYLHCDPTASHYLKLILDAVFGHENFRNEVIWKRSISHSLSNKLDRTHDAILYYSKSLDFTFNPVYTQYTDDYLKRFSKQDPDGRCWQDVSLTAGSSNVSSEALSRQPWRGFYPPAGRNWSAPRFITDHLELPRNMSIIDKLEALDRAGYIYWPSNGGTPRFKQYLDMIKGVPISDVWTDIFPINSQAQERLGYPTQKPVALLERIIQASSNVGDVVLDPFCGCGTAVHAAQKLGRNWIGIDITHLAISLIEKRMKDAFPEANFEVIGSPKDLESAQDLAIRDKYQFQWWAVSLVGAHPYQDKKKGSDSGIDGLLYFTDDEDGEYKKIVVSVKGGENVGVSMIRDLAGTMEREKAAMGFFVTLAEPTAPMTKEAASKDPYISPLTKELFPRIQILTIKGLMDGTEKPRYPDLGNYKGMFKKAKLERTEKETKLF